MKFFGIDRIIILSLFSKAWLILAGILTIYLVGTKLTIVEQGFFYVLNSLVSIQIFFELGLNTAIIQYVSHEMPKLKWKNKILIGEQKAKETVSSIIRIIVKWYSFVTLILFFIVLPMGYFLFFNTEEASNINANTAWIILVIFVAINLFISSIISLIEGTLHIYEAVLMRFLQAFLSTLVVLIALYSEEIGVMSLPIGSVVAVIITMVYIFRKYSTFFIDMYSLGKKEYDIRELFSFQWKVAVSWIAGFVVYHLPTPLMMNLKSPELAGIIGMSYQIMLAITGTAIVWMTTSSAKFGKLVSSKDFVGLDQLFKKQLKTSLVFLVLVLVLFNLVINTLVFQESDFSSRVVSSEIFLLLSIITIALHLHLSQQLYLRAHKEEPFWKLSIVMALIVFILSLVLIPKYEIFGSIVAYFIGMVGIGLCYGTVVFFRFKRNRQ